MERDNVAEFLQASETIYNWLREMSKPNAPVLQWESELKPELCNLFEGPRVVEPDLTDHLSMRAYRSYHTQDLDERCKRWKKAFADLFAPRPEEYSYDREHWRKKALDGPTDWDDFSQRDWDQTLFGLRRNFWNSLWVHFHRAALLQRHFVLENLP